MKLRQINTVQLVWTLVVLALGASLGLLLGPNLARFSNTTLALFISPLVASLLGAGTAYLGFRRSQRMDAELVKVDKLNSGVFLLFRCVSALCAIKKEYFDSIGTDYYRCLMLARNIKNIEKVNPDISGIQFLLSKPNDESKINLVRMSFALDNFNLIVDMLELRNSLHNEFLDAARKTGKYAGGGITEGFIAELKEELGEGKLDVLLHAGEQLIATIDFTIIDLYEAQKELQVHGRTKIHRDLLDEPMFVKYEFDASSPYEKLISTPVPKGEWEESETGN